MEEGENPKIPRGSRRIREGKGKVRGPIRLSRKVMGHFGTFRDILGPKCGKKICDWPELRETVGAASHRIDFVPVRLVKFSEV